MLRMDDTEELETYGRDRHRYQITGDTYPGSKKEKRDETKQTENSRDGQA